MQVAAGCRKRACDAVPFSGTIMHYQNVGSGLMIGLGNRYCGFFQGSSGRKNLSTAFGQIMRDEHWARLRLLSTFFKARLTVVWANGRTQSIGMSKNPRHDTDRKFKLKKAKQYISSRRHDARDKTFPPALPSRWKCYPSIMTPHCGDSLNSPIMTMHRTVSGKATKIGSADFCCTVRRSCEPRMAVLCARCRRKPRLPRRPFAGSPHRSRG